MSEIATTQSSELAIAPQQSAFTEQQVAALTHIGVQDASPGDLAVFFHVVQRTGLDPFARQIYMIGRRTKDLRTGEWTTKQTIQTGIDGFRLIGRRASARSGGTMSVSAPEWSTRDGKWVDVWSAEWGTPLAARVTITRDGDPFTAVAMFDEYAQTTREDKLTQMWRQRPAGQIAKCAEAAAWRMAFPQDLAGVYSDEELQHADSPPPGRRTERRSAAGLLDAPADDAPADDAPHPAEPPAPEEPTATVAELMAALERSNVSTDPTQQRDWVNGHLPDGREVQSPSDLTGAERAQLVAILRSNTAHAREVLDAAQDDEEAR